MVEAHEENRKIAVSTAARGGAAMRSLNENPVMS
jgi:hypothetical protein